MIELSTYEEFVDCNWFGGSPEYTMIALAGEVGEACNFHKKIMRASCSPQEAMAHRVDKIAEFGDVLYYLVKACHDEDVTLAEVMEANHVKLLERNCASPR